MIPRVEKSKDITALSPTSPIGKWVYGGVLVAVSLMAAGVFAGIEMGSDS